MITSLLLRAQAPNKKFPTNTISGSSPPLPPSALTTEGTGGGIPPLLNALENLAEQTPT